MSDTLQFVEPWLKGGQNITLTLARGYLTKRGSWYSTKRQTKSVSDIVNVERL